MLTIGNITSLDDVMLGSNQKFFLYLSGNGIILVLVLLAMLQQNNVLE